MAYSRYSKDCDWYIFWCSTKEDEVHANREQPKSKEAQRIAVWHADHRSTQPLFTYPEVRRLLDSNDFSQIPGFQERDRELLRGCLIDAYAELLAAGGASF